ncbi:MAG: hypothetical protein WAV60_02660, partial [Anaerolineae bacterium]
ARRATPPTAGIQPQGQRYPQVSLVCSSTRRSGWGAGVAAGCGWGAGCTPPLTGVGGTTAWQAVSHSSKSNPTSALGAGWRRPRLAN